MHPKPGILGGFPIQSFISRWILCYRCSRNIDRVSYLGLVQYIGDLLAPMAAFFFAVHFLHHAQDSQVQKKLRWTILTISRKHEATHIKPFVCEYCKNVVKSFASKTDLQRHTNNVHFSSPSSAFSYRCKYDQCANRQRIILRLDNFKTHLKRKHKKPEEPDSDDFYSRFVNLFVFKYDAK